MERLLSMVNRNDMEMASKRNDILSNTNVIDVKALYDDEKTLFKLMRGEPSKKSLSRSKKIESDRLSKLRNVLNLNTTLSKQLDALEVVARVRAQQQLAQMPEWGNAVICTLSNYAPVIGRDGSVENIHINLGDDTIVDVNGFVCYDPSLDKHFSVLDIGSRPRYYSDKCVHYWSNGKWIARRLVGDNRGSGDLVDDPSKQIKKLNKYLRDKRAKMNAKHRDVMDQIRTVCEDKTTLAEILQQAYHHLNLESLPSDKAIATILAIAGASRSDLQKVIESDGEEAVIDLIAASITD